MNNFTPIQYKGKPYFTVATRVAMVHASGKSFEICMSEPIQVADRWLWKVVIRVDDKQFIGSAEVKLLAGKNTADGQNPFECAETSALGRALGFAGFGSVESIATVDEIVRSQPIDQHHCDQEDHSTQPLIDQVSPNFEPRAHVDRACASPPPLATPQQKQALEKLCKAKRQSLPRNWHDMSQDEARVWIASLQKLEMTVKAEPVGFHKRELVGPPSGGRQGFSVMR